MNKAAPPTEIVEAARRRSAAREARDWTTADQLRAEIEAAGWRVVDSGTSFRLEAVHPPQVIDGDVVRYGRSDAVPSLLGEPDKGLATVVIVGEADAGEVVRALTTARTAAAADVSFVVVANGMAASAEAEVERAATGVATGGVATGEDVVEPVIEPATGLFELVRTSARLGRATALNMGVRRSTGAVVVLLDPSIEAEGDFVTPLVRALDDPSVAVAGAVGLTSADLRKFDRVVAPGADSLEAAVIEGDLMAFRRADAAARGPLEEQFRVARNLDVWWSLVLRDEGEEQVPRRAIVVPDLPIRAHDVVTVAAARQPEQERLAKRSYYWVLDRFGRRMDLAVPVE